MLRPLQETFSADEYPDLLVGLSAPDDAAVWRLDEQRLLVMTTDFFTPVVDDGYDYGAIAAANALSDIYAMAAKPFMALNIACLPNSLPAAIVADIFRGLSDVVKEAGAVIAGGHTIQDEEPKVGLVVLGFANEGELLTKSGAQPGDVLVLTKPIGTGLIATALKAGQSEAAHLNGAVRWMKRLNREAVHVARELGVHAATDITGFSLLGHGLEMARNSNARLQFEHSAIPLLPGAAAYARRGFVPAGSTDNRSYFSQQVSFAQGMTDLDETLLFDAQTSGGLLLSVPSPKLPLLLAAAEEISLSAWVVGSVGAGEGVDVIAGDGPRGAAIEEAEVEYPSHE